MNAPKLALFLVAFCLPLCCAQAHAQWRIDSIKDRMTDKAEPVASVLAKEPAAGVTARLQVECLVDRLVGGWVTSVVLSRDMEPGAVPLTYRIDNQPTEHRIMPVSPSIDSVSILGLDADELRNAKRFHVEITPLKGPKLLYDFDVTGADRALKAVPCVNTRTNG